MLFENLFHPSREFQPAAAVDLMTADNSDSNSSCSCLLVSGWQTETEANSLHFKAGHSLSRTSSSSSSSDGTESDSNAGTEGRSQIDSRFCVITAICYSYTHPTLGKVYIDPEIVELAFLSVLFEQKVRIREYQHKFVSFNFKTATFPRTRCTGNKPYIVTDPRAIPLSKPASAIARGSSAAAAAVAAVAATDDDDDNNNYDYENCPRVIGYPESIGYSRRCVLKYTGNQKEISLMENAITQFLAERLRLIVDYFLWIDALVFEEWTYPIICSSVSLGFRKYYCSCRRADFYKLFEAFCGGGVSVDDTNQMERFMLDLVDSVIHYICGILLTYQYMSRAETPSIIDGVVYSNLVVLLAAPISDHDGLSRILLDNSVRSILESYCNRMNSLVSPQIWSNRNSYLIGLVPSPPPYPGNANSARSKRESDRCRKMFFVDSNNTDDDDDDGDSNERNEGGGGNEQQQQQRNSSSSSSSSIISCRSIKRYSSKGFSFLISALTEPLLITTETTHSGTNKDVKNGVTKGKESDKSKNHSKHSKKHSSAVSPHLFIGIAAILLFGFVLAGKSPMSFRA